MAPHQDNYIPRSEAANSMCLVWLLYKNFILLKGLFYLKTRVEIALVKPAMGSVCQNPQNFHLFFRTQWPGLRASTVIIEFRSTPFDLFSFKLVFEHSKSESQPDVSVTRISYTLFPMVLRRLGFGHLSNGY